MEKISGKDASSVAYRRQRMAMIECLHEQSSKNGQPPVSAA
jgi:hypothetical protein